MKLVKRSLIFAVLCLSLVSCGETKESSSSPASSTPKESEPAPSSKDPEVSSSQISSSPISSEEPAPSTAVTKAIDFTKFTALTAAGDADDGFFYGVGVKYKESKSAGTVQTGGSGVISSSKLNHVIYFTTTGSGTITLSGKSGSKEERRLYLVKEGAEQGDFTAEGVQVCTLTEAGEAADFTDTVFNLPKAGKYYLMSNENVTLSKIEVTYDPAKAEGSANNTTVTLARNSYLDAELLYPGKIANNTVYGDFTFTSAGSEVIFKGKVNGKKPKRDDKVHYNYVHLKQGDTVKFTSAGAGTATVAIAYAKKTLAEDGTTALDTTVTLTDGTTPTTKTLHDDSVDAQSLSFNVSAGTYTLSADHDIYFQALNVAVI